MAKIKVSRKFIEESLEIMTLVYKMTDFENHKLRKKLNRLGIKSENYLSK